MLRFGQSSRMYLLNGPSELMPEEGLSRQQRQQLKALEAAQKARAHDEERAAAQMAAAIGGGGGGAGGASWGMDDDDEWAAAQQAGGEVDWRRWLEKNKPTEKQQKLLDRIR